MKFLVIVEAAPLVCQRNTSAYRFCNACLNSGQIIEQVFFFGDGALTANLVNHPPSDEVNWTERWAEWSLAHQIPLKCCITSAVRRGIFNEEESRLSENKLPTYHSAFEISGLGQMMAVMKQVDRIIQF